jgi:hypothetical protein
MKNMKRFLMGAAAASALLMSACTNSGTGTTTATDIATIINNVQTIAKTTCQYIPTAVTISQIVSAGNPAVSTADQIATAICSAVAGSATNPSATLPSASATPTHDGNVGNVAVIGWRVP